MATIRIYMSTNTLEVITSAFDTSVDKWCEYHKVEKALVLAIIHKESESKPFAIRYEHHLKKTKWYTNTIPEKYKDDKFAYCSMGYMQVLYGIARSYGFKGTPHDLISPDNSIKYGVRHLKELIKRYKNIERAISAYNQGSPRKNKATGEFNNQAYVDKVTKYYKRFGGSVSIP